MTDGFKTWWRGRTLREHRLLLAMAGLGVVVFAWLLVIRPLDDALSQARERHAAAVLALAETRAQAALVAGLETARPASLGGALDTVLMQSATEAGFQVARIDRMGANQATLAIAAVRPQAFFGWVGQMESGRGLIVERLTGTTNSDQTLSVEVTFRARTG